MDITKPYSARASTHRRRALIGIAALVPLAVFLAFASLGDPEIRLDRSTLWIDAARRGEMLNEIRATGTLIPKHIRWITAEVEGTVQEVLVLPGAKVEAGTVIIRMSNPAARVDYERARATHAGAEADAAIKAAQLDLEIAEQEAIVGRARSNYLLSKARTDAQIRAEAAGAVSKMELHQSRIELDRYRADVVVEEKRLATLRSTRHLQITAIRADRDQSASALALAEREWEALDVHAGISGVLQQIDAEPGQQMAVGARLARVADQDLLIARLLVPESQAKDLSLGLPVQVDMRTAQVAGVIERIDPAVKEGRVSIDVLFADRLPQGARPDLSVDGRIVLAKLPDAVSIARPPGAVAHSEGDLFVMRSDSMAERIRVRYGAASSDRIQVLDGLKSGDRVILSGTADIGKGAQLKIE